MLPLRQRAVRGDVAFEVRGIAGREGFLPNLPFTSYAPLVHVHVSAPGRRRVHVLGGKDDRGRAFAGYINGGSGSDYLFRLETRPGAKTVSFTLAAPESRFVEFLARPGPLPPD